MAHMHATLSHICKPCSVCAMSNLLAMVVIEPHFRLLSMFIATNMEIICNCALFISSFFLGLGGVPPHQRHPQIPLFAQTSMPNYDPFPTSSFDCNLGRNDNQTFIVHMESTLVLYRKGLCGFFSVLRFALEEKLCCTKCHKYFGPEGVC